MKRLITHDVLSLAHATRPDFLIDPLITERSITGLVGATFSGKSFFALEAARAIAFNQLFMGKHEVPHPGNVLFFEADSPEWDLGVAMRKMLDPIWDRITPTSTSFPASALQFYWKRDLDLGNRDNVASIIHTANSLLTQHGKNQDPWEGARLIVFDTFRRYHLKDEDKSTDMAPIMDALDIIREGTGASIIFLHHEPKAAGRSFMRGSTVIEGNADNIIRIRGSKKAPEKKVTFEKARAAQPEDFQFLIDDKTKRVVATDAAQGAVNLPYRAMVRWIMLTGRISEATAKRHLRQGVLDGTILKSETEAGSTYRRQS